MAKHTLESRLGKKELARHQTLTPSNRQFKGCMQKKRFATRNQARNACGVQRSNQGVERVEYKCPSCKGWHLTSKG